MEWIQRQIERQLNRLIVGWFQWVFDVSFNRRQQLRVFRRLIVYQLICVVTLEWMNSQKYSFGRTSAIVLLKIGLVSITTVEYLAMIRIGWNNFGGVARAVFIVNYTASIFAVVACTIDRRLEAIPTRFIALSLFYHYYQNVRWFIGIDLSSKPILFQIRKSIPGQQHPQMIQLVVWLYQDFCQLFNAQLVANLPPIQNLHVPHFAWPTMDEAPRWILMKLSENAAMAG